MSYSHSRNPDLPITHSSPISMWLGVLFFSSPAKTTLSCRVIGFVGGGGNIAIETTLPPSYFVYGISLSYYLCLPQASINNRLHKKMWSLTRAGGVHGLLSADYSVVMCGAWPGTLVT